MNDIEIRHIEQIDRAAVMAILTGAFHFDPLLRWIYADDSEYARHFEGFVYAYGGDPFERNSGLIYQDAKGCAIVWQFEGLSSHNDKILPYLKRYRYAV
ncbi:hypothetical protein [Paraburkholderia kururiensis]|uniref:hypothetical protein n=1 Tax=Paraburkholderia kururiensis TaxID=984307 RepID=UPI000ADE0EEC|nr:hypothetical protein [Paraburkholderia kururiensis]